MSAEQQSCGAGEALLPALRQAERLLAWARFEEAASASLALLRLHPLSTQGGTPATPSGTAESTAASSAAAPAESIQSGVQPTRPEGSAKGSACDEPSIAAPEDVLKRRASPGDSAADLAAHRGDASTSGASEASESCRAGTTYTHGAREADVLLRSEACEAAGAVWMQALDKLGRHQETPDELIRTFGHLAKVPETLLLVWFSVEAMPGRNLALSQVLRAALQPSAGAGQQGAGSSRASDSPASMAGSTMDATVGPTVQQMGRLLELYALLVLTQGLKDGATAAGEVARGEELGWLSVRQGERLRRAIAELERQQLVQRRQETKAARAKTARHGDTPGKDLWATGDGLDNSAMSEWHTDPGRGAGPSGVGKVKGPKRSLQNGSVAQDREDNASDSEAAHLNGAPWSASAAAAVKRDAGGGGAQGAVRGGRRSHASKDRPISGDRSQERVQQDALHKRAGSSAASAGDRDGSSGRREGRGVFLWPVLVAVWRLGGSTRTQGQAVLHYIVHRAPWLGSFASGPALVGVVLAAALVLIMRRRVDVSRALQDGYQRVRRTIVEAWLLAFSVNLNPMVQNALPQ